MAVAAETGISRQQAQALILAGSVLVDGVPQRKAGLALVPGAVIEVKREQRFVGRGGLKIERALDEFAWSVEGLRCLDVGASTGGFTDCLLQRGASAVTAVDVGYGHLAWKLRNDPRVTVFERTNFRHADVAQLGAPFDFACVDVSFISLGKLAGQLCHALERNGRLVALVKPQFEAGRTLVQRGGIVRSAETHVQVLRAVTTSFNAAGLGCVELTYSPVTGTAGNIEFLLGAIAGERNVRPLDVAGVVRRAHETLER